MGFQSTRPSRGETLMIFFASVRVHISIHSPLAGRDRQQIRHRGTLQDFNPLAPRGARPTEATETPTPFSFQSTRPSRGETGGSGADKRHRRGFQSTRPSRGETAATPSWRGWAYFNPLAPRGARRALSPAVPDAKRFQSTRPSRGETGTTIRP